MGRRKALTGWVRHGKSSGRIHEFRECQADSWTVLRIAELPQMISRNGVGFMTIPAGQASEQGCIIHPLMFSPLAWFDPGFLRTVISKVSYQLQPSAFSLLTKRIGIGYGAASTASLAES